MKYCILTTIFTCVIAYFSDSNVLAADHITGRACYHYSDNESLIAARDITLSLAKRDALESYLVFVQAASKLDNFQLKNDIVATITGGYLSNMRVLEEKEDVQKKEICRQISADIDPFTVKEQVQARITSQKLISENSPTGLPENKLLRVLKVDKRSCGSRNEVQCVFVSVLCKQEARHISGPRLTWIDSNGMPEETYDDDFDKDTDRKTFRDYPSLDYRKGCPARGDTVRYQYPFPPQGFSFKIGLP